MTITDRPFRDPSDVARMKRLVVEGRAASPHSGYMHCGDVDWRLFGPHGFPLEEIVRLWEDAGDLAGWALLSADGVDYQVHPSRRSSSLERSIIGWGQEQTLAWRLANRLAPNCVVECYVDDAERMALLEEMGYIRTDRGAVHFVRDLADAIDEPAIWDGWAVRGLRQESVESRAAPQAEAFAPGSKTTPSTWRHMMANAAGYDPELDSIVAMPDGTIVSAALAWLDTHNRVGEFEPVGTRPACWRMGFARLAMLRGLRVMRERGMETAIVQTNATNAPAIGLYESVGFAIVNRSVEYEYVPDT